MNLKNENGWLIDGNENKWSIDFFGGEEKAKIAAESCHFDRKSFNNINCSRISDCIRLSDCSRISDFRRIYDSSRISDSRNLSDCVRLYDCRGIYDCSRLYDCSKIYDSSRISDCSRISDFRRISDCHGLSDCCSIYDCKSLSFGDVQFFATGKYTLTIYNDICQAGWAKKTLQEWLSYAGDDLNSDDKKYLETWTKPIIRTVLESRKLNNKEGEVDE